VWEEYVAVAPSAAQDVPDPIVSVPRSVAESPEQSGDARVQAMVKLANHRAWRVLALQAETAPDPWIRERARDLLKHPPAVDITS
jgi:hypothetical protein